MLLKIYHPLSYSLERDYIFHVIFEEFLGLRFETIRENRKNVQIVFNNSQIIMPDILFQIPEGDWLTTKSLPIQSLYIWDVSELEITEILVNKQLPIIYGKELSDKKYLDIKENEIVLGIDIFGSAFFMLTRYEEVVKNDRDKHDRFPSKASLAYQEGFLERPIINEYIELLWWAMKKLWPELNRKKRQFQIMPTHDIDSPFQMLFLSPYQIIRFLAGDILKRKNIATFTSRAINAYNVKIAKNVLTDRYYTFNLIMDISERNNLMNYFYIMTTQGLSKLDGNYCLNNPYIINLMKSIKERGHEIGLHPSYISYNDGEEIKRETEQLCDIFKKIGISQEMIGGRQHYLKWQCPVTWQYYENAGLRYDTTLSYADHIGFRCGVCYEYPVFNIHTKQVLKLKERPLIVMERSALAECYMNLSYNEAFRRIIRLRDICKKYNGEFVLLWHNTSFLVEEEIDLYIEFTKS